MERCENKLSWVRSGCGDMGGIMQKEASIEGHLRERWEEVC